MSFHFLSHRWEVENLQDGIIVTLSDHDLDADLAEELIELFQESGQPNLYLDFRRIDSLASILFGQLTLLHLRLGKAGNRLILCNLNPSIRENLEAARLTSIFDIREGPLTQAVSVR